MQRCGLLHAPPPQKKGHKNKCILSQSSEEVAKLYTAIDNYTC